MDYASHSAHVEDIRSELADELAGITPLAPQVPFLSTVTGEWVTGAELDSGYWYRNLRGTVRLEEAVRTLLTAGHRALVEVGAHPVLVAGLEDTVAAAGARAVVTGTLRRDDGGLDRLYTSAAALAVRGVPVDWGRCAATGRRIGLPTYPFQNARYWSDPVLPPRPGGEDGAPDDTFWDAVEAADLPALTADLGVDEAVLAPVLPALGEWRRRRRDRSTTDSWRYRTTWTPLGRLPLAALHGTWVLVEPDPTSELADPGTPTPSPPRCAGTAPRCTASPSTRPAPIGGARRPAGRPVRPGPRPGRHPGRHRHRRHRRPGCGVAARRRRRPHPGHPRAAARRGLDPRARPGADRPRPGRRPAHGPGLVPHPGRGRHRPGRPALAPVRAIATGIGWTAALEHPRSWGGTVDLPPELDRRAAQRLVSVLAGGTGEDQLAIRASGALARRIERAAARDDRPRPWSFDGTTVITGGTGTLGPHVARWAAHQGAEHLVLLSRRGPDAPGAAELAADLTGLGADVEIRSCDITDLDALSAVLDDLAAAGRTVHTVLHTAAVIELGSIAETDPAQVERVLHAKVTGAANLDRLLGDDVAELVLSPRSPVPGAAATTPPTWGPTPTCPRSPATAGPAAWPRRRCPGASGPTTSDSAGSTPSRSPAAAWCSWTPACRWTRCSGPSRPARPI